MVNNIIPLNITQSQYELRNCLNILSIAGILRNIKTNKVIEGII